MMKNTLIINYAGMSFGGIEKYFSRLMEYSIKQGYRVIWITKDSCIVKSKFKNVTDDNRVEKVINKARFWFKIDPISFDTDEHIVMLSCEPLIYLYGEEIKKYIPNKSLFSHFLVLPHYTGAAYYPERFFRFPIFKKIVFSFFKKIITRLNNNDLILAFSLKHLDNYEANYHITFLDKNNNVLKSLEPKKCFDSFQTLAKAKERKKCFEIITCGRFDFPHKGYMIGLVKAFAVLKKRFNQIKLCFIGDGSSRHELEKVIMELPNSIKKDITLLGYISPDRTPEYYSKATLAVGVAGALGDAARCGLPSIRVRHYCYECEAYGFVGEQKQTKWDEPGLDIVPFIERMIVCSDNEYVEQAKNDYDKIYENYHYDPEFVFKKKNYLDKDFNKFTLFLARLVNLLKNFLIKVFNRAAY